MRISYNWIKDLVPDLTLTPPELAELLTRHSFETNVAGEYGVPSGIKTVQITNVAKHPKADRLQLARITAGRNEITLVCGAPNIQVGQIVPYSPPGATVFDDEGKELLVEAREIRGEMSEGMLNSLRELGLHHDHGGIWILPPDTPLGVELSALIPRDTLLEADITPNRAHDCLSHIGVAREVAALLRLPIAEPAVSDLPEPQADVQGFTVEIIDSRLCPRYLAAVVDNLTLAPSPLWLQARLLAAGGKPISNLVDVTNYVTFEYGNPTHLFDEAKLRSERSRGAQKTIGVRSAQEKESLTTLDEVKRELLPADIVITVNDKPVALAGIMGGGGDAVSEHTQQGLLEAASFNAFSIQETSRRLPLRTEASARFSKGLDPNLVAAAAARALELLRETAGAKIVGVIDVYPRPVGPRVISFRPSRVSEVAGSDIFTNQDSKRILTHLRCAVKTSSDEGEVWNVTIPTDRLDIEGEHDLVEEIVRVTGLDKIEPSSPQLLTTAYSLPSSIYWREVIRDTLVELGLTETLNYSFAAEGELELANPPAPEKKYLRTSLLPGLLANLEKNRDALHREPAGFFEIGHVYKPAGRSPVAASGGFTGSSRVPGVIESTHLAAVVAGGSPSLEQISQKIAEALSIDPLILKNIITSEMISALKYRLPVAGFEINLDELLQKVEKPVPSARTLEEIQAQSAVPGSFKPLPKYPSVFRDISLLVDPSVSVEQAQEIIERAGGDLVADVDLFDEFQPSPDLPAGQAGASAGAVSLKSLAFHIEYRSPDRTLTDEEINPIHAKIISALESEVDAQVR